MNGFEVLSIAKINGARFRRKCWWADAFAVLDARGHGVWTQKDKTMPLFLAVPEILADDWEIVTEEKTFSGE